MVVTLVGLVLHSHFVSSWGECTRIGDGLRGRKPIRRWEQVERGDETWIWAVAEGEGNWVDVHVAEGLREKPGSLRELPSAWYLGSRGELMGTCGWAKRASSKADSCGQLSQLLLMLEREKERSGEKHIKYLHDRLKRESKLEVFLLLCNSSRILVLQTHSAKLSTLKIKEGLCLQEAYK